jgi:subfamily B ATP-binding cassette protein HlyB/CyaB
MKWAGGVECRPDLHPTEAHMPTSAVPNPAAAPTAPTRPGDNATIRPGNDSRFGTDENIQADRAADQPQGPAANSSALGGLNALCLLARFHHVAGDPQALLHALGKGTSDAIGSTDLLLAAKQLGLKAKLSRSSVERLPQLALPALALLNDGRIVLLARCDTERVLWVDAGATPADVALPPGQTAAPAQATLPPIIMPLQTFAAAWSGQLILVTSRASLVGQLARFDFSWFIPSLVKYRRLLGEVLLVSFFLQLAALVSPLFFQAVMDKVLVHNALTTLDVLMIGLGVVIVFESVLTLLRSYVFSHTTSRIDVELGARLFRHLLQLPMAYFQARRVGDSVARVRELENIRSFLTGNAVTLLLDLLFSGVFIAVMFSYSTSLTTVVLLSLPVYVGISLMVLPILRRRLDEKFARGAENQALLVETVTSMLTVKACALEPQMARHWDQQLAAYVSASFKSQNLAQQAHEAVNLVGKVVNLLILWMGARLVMDHELTVGQFVAFNMFAGRVAQPIMRMAQLWTDFQQVGLSMARLGDILNTPTEVPSQSASPLPSLSGRVTFDNVSFRYPSGNTPVLSTLSLDVRPGEVIGIVGRSGSGKSTLAKLVQRLYVPEAGRVLIDGHDIALIDAAQLRRQVGVVLQDNQLFARSVRENIAITDPAAPMDAVVAAAKLAGAHEFIAELPQGYDTLVGESGSSLSGGQRQRIAIARALFSQPRIVIFDEATSALDYESEAILQRNMQAICQGRTVFIIAHRLSAVRHAHRIIVLERGRLVEQGPHDQLMRNPKGIYAHLWRLQGGATQVAAVAPQNHPAQNHLSQTQVSINPLPTSPKPTP